MKNKDYESNVIKSFAETLNNKTGSSYSFKKSDNTIDDGYLVSNNGDEIPVQLVLATDKNLEREINHQIHEEAIFAYDALDPIQPIKKAIESKSNKHYSHSKELILLVYPSTCHEWLDSRISYLQSLPEIANFRAIYIFYPSTCPGLFTLKSL